MKSQKQSVLDAIIVVKGVLTKDMSKLETTQVSEIVLSEIEDGTCRFDGFDKYNTLELRFGYVKGMVNNWIRKAPELNDGVKYTPKYSKGPQKSETLRALEELSRQHPDNEEVQTALADQIAKEVKVKTEKKINVDALPEHLRNLVG
jgi:hypothetical protein